MYYHYSYTQPHSCFGQHYGIGILSKLLFEKSGGFNSKFLERKLIIRTPKTPERKDTFASLKIKQSHWCREFHQREILL